MTQHVGRDITFEVPDDWEDRSTTVYAAPALHPRSTAPNVVVTRDRLVDGDRPAPYVHRLIAQLALKLTGFELQEQRDVALGGLEGKELVYHWLGDSERIVQRLAMAFDGSHVTCITTTSTRGEAEQAAPLFQRILASVRFPSSNSPPSSAPPTRRETPAAAAPAPSLRSTHRMAPRTIADESGRARAAVAALWQRPVDGLDARSLSTSMPWICRHEVVYVTDHVAIGVVVASGATEPLVFTDPSRLVELNAFLRAERISLPHGLAPDDLAQAVRTLLYGPEGWVGSPAFFQREHPRYEDWVGHASERGERLFRDACRGAALHSEGDDEGWSLHFHCFSRSDGVERWEVAGRGSRVRKAGFTVKIPPPGSPAISQRLR